MDILDELEAMAQAASAFQDDETVPESTIARWQKLFATHLQRPRGKSESIETTLCASQLLMITGLSGSARDRNQRQEMTMKEKRKLRAAVFLIKLEGPLSSVQAVIQAAGLWCPSSTEVLAATNLTGQPCSFFKINGMDKLAIEGWLQENPQLGFEPTIIQDPYALKDLSPTSVYPNLGVDTTLPQFRPRLSIMPRPSQNEYPVWYFFYGTLTDAFFLSKLFGPDYQAEYHAATIRGGTLKTWGRYYALVDDPSHTNLILGKAVLVETREQEDRLRAYETNAYEVVRCSIEMNPDMRVDGLTFRFITDIMD